MTPRILLAGLAGGIVVFIWGAISHMALPLGEMGIRPLPGDSPVVGAMRDNLRERAIYFYPGPAETPGATAVAGAAADERWKEQIRRGPVGILVYTPGGQEPFAPRQFLGELASNLLAALAAAVILARCVTRGYLARVGLVALLGLFAWLSTEVSYWNWYGFPGVYALAQLIDQVVGFALCGLVLAALLPPARA